MPHWLFLTLLIAGGWISALVVFYALCERHFPYRPGPAPKPELRLIWDAEREKYWPCWRDPEQPCRCGDGLARAECTIPIPPLTPAAITARRRRENEWRLAFRPFDQEKD
jgi:hypothetical protein